MHCKASASMSSTDHQSYCTGIQRLDNNRIPSLVLRPLRQHFRVRKRKARRAFHRQLPRSSAERNSFSLMQLKKRMFKEESETCRQVKIRVTGIGMSRSRNNVNNVSLLFLSAAIVFNVSTTSETSLYGRS